MEPPGLVEEMSGGGSGMPLRGLTAASLLLSCGRLGSEGWPGCWNAERQARDSWDLVWLFDFWQEVSYGILASKRASLRQRKGLTVEVKQVLVMTDLGHVSWGHGVGGENWPTQVGGPQVIWVHSLLLGITVWRECPGLFCTTQTESALSQTLTNPRRCPSAAASIIIIIIIFIIIHTTPRATSQPGWYHHWIKMPTYTTSHCYSYCDAHTVKSSRGVDQPALWLRWN